MAHIRDDLSTGRRLYIQTAYREPVVDRLKELGAHWCADHRAWWISPKKRPQVEELLVGADQQKESGAEPEQKPESADDVKLVGKCRYKGRTYYCRFIGPTKRGCQARLCTLPDAGGKWLDFWAPAYPIYDGGSIEEYRRNTPDGNGDIAVLTRTYPAREVWDGRRYSNRTVTQHTTLGSIADFIGRQKTPGQRRVQCVECGSWSDEGEPCRDCGGG